MALGTLAPEAWQTFFTDAGAIAAGYKVFTYAAGTTTKQTTYTDANLTVANTNPIILDSAGRCVMFFPVGAAFKCVLTTPTDSDPPVSPIKTQDNIATVPLLQGHGRKTADQTFTTTTLTDVTNLSFSVSALEAWEARVYVHGNAPVAADWKFTFTGPGSPTSVRFGVVSQGAGGATGIGAQSALAFGTAVQVESDGQEEMVYLHLYLINGSNSGTVQLQAAQFVASGTSTIRANSIIVMQRLP
jgi:hypothetical protein